MNKLNKFHEMYEIILDNDFENDKTAELLRFANEYSRQTALYRQAIYVLGVPDSMRNYIDATMKVCLRFMDWAELQLRTKSYQGKWGAEMAVMELEEDL